MNINNFTKQETKDYWLWRKQAREQWLKFLAEYHDRNESKGNPSEVPKPVARAEQADFPCSRLYRDYIEDNGSASRD